MSWASRLAFGSALTDAAKQHYLPSSGGQPAGNGYNHYGSQGGSAGTRYTPSGYAHTYNHTPYYTSQYSYLQDEICYCEAGPGPARGQGQRQGHAAGSRRHRNQSSHGRGGIRGQGPVHQGRVHPHIHHRERPVSQHTGQFDHMHCQTVPQQATPIPFRPEDARAGVYAQGYVAGLHAAEAGPHGRPTGHGGDGPLQLHEPRADPRASMGGSRASASHVEEANVRQGGYVPASGGTDGFSGNYYHGYAVAYPSSYPNGNPSASVIPDPPQSFVVDGVNVDRGTEADFQPPTTNKRGNGN